MYIFDVLSGSVHAKMLYIINFRKFIIEQLTGLLNIAGKLLNKTTFFDNESAAFISTLGKSLFIFLLKAVPLHLSYICTTSNI